MENWCDHLYEGEEEIGRLVAMIYSDQRCDHLYEGEQEIGRLVAMIYSDERRSSCVLHQQLAPICNNNLVDTFAFTGKIIIGSGSNYMQILPLL